MTSIRASFRSQFAPKIAAVISRYPNQPLAIIRKWLRREWAENVRNESNSYMVSAWSKEVGKQLATHRDNQESVDSLPLFDLSRKEKAK